MTIFRWLRFQIAFFALIPSIAHAAISFPGLGQTFYLAVDGKVKLAQCETAGFDCTPDATPAPKVIAEMPAPEYVATLAKNISGVFEPAAIQNPTVLDHYRKLAEKLNTDLPENCRFADRTGMKPECAEKITKLKDTLSTVANFEFSQKVVLSLAGNGVELSVDESPDSGKELLTERFFWTQDVPIVRLTIRTTPAPENARQIILRPINSTVGNFLPSAVLEQWKLLTLRTLIKKGPLPTAELQNEILAQLRIADPKSKLTELSIQPVFVGLGGAHFLEAIETDANSFRITSAGLAHFKKSEKAVERKFASVFNRPQRQIGVPFEEGGRRYILNSEGVKFIWASDATSPRGAWFYLGVDGVYYKSR